MKKAIATIGVAVLLTGCSGTISPDTNSTNPDVNFDETYQGSPEIDQENANMVEPTEMPEDVIVEPMEETSTGDIIIENAEVGTGTEVLEPMMSEPVMPEPIVPEPITEENVAQ